MPCIGGPTWEQERDERKAKERKERELARMEPLLCSACRGLERLGYDFDENPELSEWWDKHKKADAARAEAERKALEKAEWERKVIKDALDKPIGTLTKEEKDLLKKHNFL